ncbi:Predicted arabinose efflux permease, MFS family [Pseudomonas linyingensis]|uniref:Predicted arabinose efflux permease, MFS family n=1 Tax=Pseudomonas linyingensis TaxID=915471 RepID=A0A1H6ZSA7_9PSED|nr:MFS transporter [Pseudomonas linyingensis]SEJ52480.1 Predicted arabinose efflux permease, MFS family [Pseudomonas linyingensis]
MNSHARVTWRTHYALAVLTVIYVFNYIDRHLMAILIEPVKAEFGISDTQIGLLSGLTFALFFTLFGFPLGRLSDRIGRKPVIALSCIAWSAMTMLCGLAGSFLFLLLARIGVAIGEAGGTAPSMAMVSDLYPPQRRSTALSVLMLGSSLGAVFGLGLGGWIAQHYGWRTAFVVIGAPGILLGILLWATVRAPKPSLPASRATSQGQIQESWFQTIALLFQTPAFSWIVLTGASAAIAGYAIGTWSPSFLIRSHGLTVQEAGMLVGVVGGSCSAIGTVTCGWLTDRMVRRDVGWQIGVPLLGTLLSIPFGLGYFLWPQGVAFEVGSITVPQAFLFYIGFGFFGTWWATPCLGAISHLFPATRLAQATAIFVMGMTLLGVGLGPLVTGMLSDYFTPIAGSEALRYSLAASMSLLVLAALFLAIALPRYRRQLAGQVSPGNAATTTATATA